MSEDLVERAVLERIARAICDQAFGRGVYDGVTIGDPPRPVQADDMWRIHLPEARAALAAMPGWQPIETARKDGTAVLVATPDGKGGWIVGEAYYRDAHEPGDRGWWWANTAPDDYYASPISEINGPIELWCPLLVPNVPPCSAKDRPKDHSTPSQPNCRGGR